MSRLGGEPPSSPPEYAPPDPPGEDAASGWHPESPEAWEEASRAVQTARESPDDLPTPGEGRRDKGSREGQWKGNTRRRRRRRLAWFLFGAAVVILASGAIVADAYVQTYRIYRDARPVLPHLTAARASLAKGIVPSGDPFSQASAAAGQAQREVDHARFTFRLVGALPLLGRPVQAVRLGVTAATEEAQAAVITRDMVVSVLGDSAVGGFGHGAPVLHNGVVDVNLLQGLVPQMQRLLAHLQAGERALEAIPSVPFVHQIDDLKAKALSESTQAIALAQRAMASIRLLPGFLGADGPRTYYLALQQNAALRGTGGSVLAYAFVDITNGRIELNGLGPIAAIDDPSNGVQVPFPPAVAWYLNFNQVSPRLAQGVNYTPDFQVVSPTWAAQLEKATGNHVDGVIAMDPVAVSYALRASNPFTVHAYPDPITAENVVSITENEQFRLPKAQQALLPGEIIHQAFNLLIRPKSLVPLLQQLSTAMAEKHLQVWSSDPQQAALIHQLGWDGALVLGTGDYVDLVQENRLPNKLDYYAHQTITYTARVSADGSVDATYHVAVTNAVPPGQPSGISGRPSDGSVNRSMMNLYVPKAASLANGEPSKRIVQHVEGAFRVFTRTIDVPPQQSVDLTLRYSIPGVVKEGSEGRVYLLTVQHQPVVNPADLTVRVILPEGASVTSVPEGWTLAGRTLTLNVPALTRDFVARIVF